MTSSQKNLRVVAIVQARLGSSRLPLKSLLSLRGHAIVDWAASRLSKARLLDDVLFAIPDTELDAVLAGHLERKGVKYIRGPENDVLARFCQAAHQARADLVLRVCADNPLIAPEAVDALISFFKNSDADYAYNHIPRGNLWPDGLGAEIVSRETLEYLGVKAHKASQREHCFNYIWDNPEEFKMVTFNPAEKWLQRPDLKLDIDSVRDFQKMALLNISPDMSLEEIIRACGRDVEA